MLAQDAGGGYKILSIARKYHDRDAEGYYAEKIYEDLADGKIVIVDMSTGTPSAIQMTSERIVRHVMDRAVSRFISDKRLHKIQIYIEEAHQLFNRDHLEEAEDDDPYVRLAKEAAKFDIGLTYATQEVTGVDERVLANTANWIVTHLNNKNETRQLAKYYNFEDFSRLTREAEDVGFARVKTKTGKYIIPTQIDLFDEDRLTEARNLYEATVNPE
jgi:DNA helicase HerA-like ATPase